MQASHSRTLTILLLFTSTFISRIEINICSRALLGSVALLLAHLNISYLAYSKRLNAIAIFNFEFNCRLKV